MISKEEFEEYDRDICREFGDVCFHCRKSIGLSETTYAITKLMTDKAFTLDFHVQCFKEIAGDSYLMEW